MARPAAVGERTPPLGAMLFMDKEYVVE